MKEAVRHAADSAARSGSPWARAQVSPAVRESPAPVVSTACTGAAGRMISCSPSQATRPRSPQVTTASGTRSASALAAWDAVVVRV
ncbi:hypothetical protein NSA19_13340 [Actinomyces bowdenii]|nr:hypothetical protein [Actinomyces bowdenii]MCR2053802.1 hypothetical protein [Actinomyces bowdenii]